MSIILHFKLIICASLFYVIQKQFHPQPNMKVTTIKISTQSCSLVQHSVHAMACKGIIYIPHFKLTSWGNVIM